MLIKLQKSEGLRQRTYALLRQRIRAGGVKPGERLVENAVAAALGVSRTPVREALALLAREGLLVPTTRGFMLPSLTENDVTEIYAMRRLLEPPALREAVEHMAPKGLAGMRAALASQREAHARDDLEAFAAGNFAFRRAWLDLVPNRRLVAAIELFNDHMQALRVRNRVKSVRQVVLGGNTEMLRAAERGDGKAALRAIAGHIDRAEYEARILVREQAEAAADVATAA